ncbi:MAG: retropepsin-like aspartic protease [Chloroflexota bacterium]
MRLELKDDLPFVSVQVNYRGKTTLIPSVLIDTGFATTILSADRVAEIDIRPSPQDRLYSIRGVGGSEVVFARQVDFLQVDDRRLSGFEIEVGGMDYGFDIHGILGMDSLTSAGAVIDLQNLQIRFR